MSPWKSRWSRVRLVKTARSKRTPSTRPSARAWLETSMVTAVAPRSRMTAKQGVQVGCLRGGPGGREHLVADVRGDGADHPGGVARGPQGGIQQVAHGRLAVGPGDARGRQRPGRLAVDRCRHGSQHTARVVDDEDGQGDATGLLHEGGARGIGQDRRGTGDLGLGSEARTVGREAGQGGVEVTRTHPPGVEGDPGHLRRRSIRKSQRAAQGGSAGADTGRSDHRDYQSVGILGDVVPDGAIFSSCRA